VTQRAFGLYLLFMCSWFLHLPARIPALGAARADLILVAVLAICAVAQGVPEQTGARGARRALTALIIYAIVSIPLVEWPGSVVKIGLPGFVKAFVFFWFTVTLVTTPKRLTWLVATFVFCQTFRVLEPLYLHLTQGYWGSAASMSDWESMQRLSGAPMDVINPNGLAFVILTTLPFLHYLSEGSTLRRVGYLAVLPAMIYALVLTASRSGMLGLGAIMALVIAKSRHKILLGVTALAIAAAVVPYLSNDLADRYLSIVSDDTKNAVTATGRTETLKSDFRVAMRRPLFGHGLGTSREANANFGTHDQPSHNLYTEALEEVGACGLVILLVFIVALVMEVRGLNLAAKAAPPDNVVAARIAAALQVWLGMNVLFSFASYGLSSFEWYFAAGLAAILPTHLAWATVPVSPPAAAEVPVFRFGAQREEQVV
jgi:O-antigen ligase